MLRRTLLLSPLGGALSAEDARLITINKIDGGLMVAVNRGSSMRRVWIILNDSTCPITILDGGIKAVYVPERLGGRYAFTATGLLQANRALRAYGIVFAQFDIWGERMRNLGLRRVIDIDRARTVAIEGAWDATEHDASAFHTTALFVDRAMDADGRIWRADLKTISAKLNEIELQASEASLEDQRSKP